MKRFADELLLALTNTGLFASVSLQIEGPIASGRAHVQGPTSRLLRIYFNEITTAARRFFLLRCVRHSLVASRFHWLRLSSEEILRSSEETFFSSEEILRSSGECISVFYLNNQASVAGCLSLWIWFTS